MGSLLNNHYNGNYEGFLRGSNVPDCRNPKEFQIAFRQCDDRSRWGDVSPEREGWGLHNSSKYPKYVHSVLNMDQSLKKATRIMLYRHISTICSKIQQTICSFASLFGWTTKNQKIIILPCRNSAHKFQFEIEFDSIKKMLLRGCCSEQGPGKVSSIANLTEHDLAASSVSL